MLSTYQKFIHASRYARYIDNLNRRESWEETVLRYVSFFKEKFPFFPDKEIYDHIVSMRVMPSMRALMTAGKALERDNAAGYNCSYVGVDDIRAFDEIMYLLLNGCGCGFSVERQLVNKLPVINGEMHNVDTIIDVPDSKIGWASSFHQLISLLYAGKIPKWNLSKIRAKGERLKTFGGRASGPAPLDELFKFTVKLFQKASGRKLNSLECHDLICYIASIVVVGGVRRCLCFDTNVKIGPNEWKQISEMRTGDKVFIEDKFETVSNVFQQGIQSVVKIELEDGTFFECTENHRWFVFNHDTNTTEWIETKNLMNCNYSMIKSITKDQVNCGKLRRITDVYYSREVETFDIEVDSPEHAFIAKSTTGAIGISHNSALISLSNLSDDRLRNAKNGQWWDENAQRALANNSVAYTEKPEMLPFLKEWTTLIESQSGERGLYNREGAIKFVEKLGRRKTFKENGEQYEYGLNPCGEILLRSSGFCNLSEVIVRNTDSLDDLKEKVRIASIIGTFQSTLTNFRYLRSIWKKNAEEERLLGVSLTGIMDHPILSKVSDEAKMYLEEMKQVAVETNAEWADKLNINRSASVTCVKPSGTVSELTDTSSGIHQRFAQYYIRRVRNDSKDPVSNLLKDSGVPYEVDFYNGDNTCVFTFIKKAPEGAVLREHMTAIDQLEHYKMMKEHWTEHNPSITVFVKEHEWLAVGHWVYTNWDHIVGISFLPYSDHVYQQAPFEEISEEQYNELSQIIPDVDFELLRKYEQYDQTTGSQELACSGGVCALS